MFALAKQIHAGGDELQDRAEIFWSGPNLVLVVADGAGGRSGAAGAAEFTVQRVTLTIHTADLSPAGLVGFLRLIDEQITREGNLVETTCVLVVITTAGIVGASVGDSVAWLITPAGIDDLTSHQSRRAFLGSGCASPVGFARGPLQGTLLVASDGLLKYSRAARIATATLAGNVESAAQNLVGLVRYASGALPDDVSVLLVRPM